MKKKTLFNFILAAIFAAIIAVLSQIAIPISEVPMTLQTFAVALAAYSLGTKFSALSVGVYLAIGAVGVPVFANFKGGLSCFAGPTGGFLIGFIFMAVLCSIAINIKNIVLKILVSAAGLIACHIFGVVWFMIALGRGLWDSFLIASAPYLIKDVVSLILAYFISISIRKGINKIN